MKTAAPGVDLGSSFPLGARVDGRGVNFSLYSKHARAIELLLFDGPDSPRPSRVVPLEPPHHRTYHYWHAHVAGLAAGQVYAFRAHGPNEPDNVSKVTSSDQVLEALLITRRSGAKHGVLDAIAEFVALA